MSAKSRYHDNIRRVSVHSAYRDSAAGRRPARGREDGGGGGEEAGQQGAGGQDEDDGHVRVAVRCRPMSDKEQRAGYASIVDFESERRIVVHDVSEPPSDQLGTKSGERRNVSHVYDFDCVFDCHSSQEEVYERACRPIVQGALEGYNGTIFAYGQTGTGKTFTMEGAGQAYRQQQQQQQRRRRSSARRLSAADKQQQQQGDIGRADSAARRRATLRDEEQLQEQELVLEQAQPVDASASAKAQAGIIPRTFEQIFNHVAAHPEFQFLIRASYLEIYQEEIRDLLKRDKLAPKLELHERPEVGVYVKELTSFVCKSIGEIERVMRVGNQNRMVGATDMNEHSSRSHAIFMITIEQQQRPKRSLIDEENDPRGAPREGNNVANSASGGGAGVIRVGKLNLVDLAGSERQRKTNSSGQRQRESIKINLSLSALGNVINSLMKIQQQRQQQQSAAAEAGGGASSANPRAPIHTPYRDSKLTRLLQDSLGGNARTLMLANIGPASYNYDETINTLNYASRARCIKNRPKLNEDPKDALLRQLQREIGALRAKLTAINSRPTTVGGGGGGEQEDATSQQRPEGCQSGGVSSAKSSSAPAKLEVERELFELRQKLSSLESKLLNGDKSSTLSTIMGHLGQEPAAAAALGAKTTTTTTTTATTTAAARQLDSQLLMGLTREQELELKRRQHELASQAGRERAIRDELERREELELLAKQSFSSIQQEVDSKRRLIRQVLLKVKALRDEIDASQAAYRIELAELEQLQCVLQRELKLKCLIMDNFVPNSHVDELLARVAYDDKRNLCLIEPLELATSDCCQLEPAAGANQKSECDYEHFWRPTYAAIRPKSEFERISEAIYPSNIRYKYEELIEPRLELDQRPRGARRLADQLRANGCHAEAAMLAAGGGGAGGQINQTTPGGGGGGLQEALNRALNERETDIVI